MGLFGKKKAMPPRQVPTGKTAEELLSEADFAAQAMIGPDGVTADELKATTFMAVVWSNGEPDVPAAYIMGGLRDWHALDLPMKPFEVGDVTEPVMNLMRSRQPWLMQIGMDPEVVVPIFLSAESHREWTEGILGTDNFAKAMDARKARLREAVSGGLPHPGNHVSVEHLWGVGFGIGIAAWRDTLVENQ